MIAYDFVAASMEGVDELQAELIVLPFFSDERPLTGIAGLIDWRLCGALSRKLMAGYLDGHFGDKGMVAAPSKLRAEALLLVGMGPVDSFDSRTAKEGCALIAEALRHSRATTAAISLPGRSLDLLPALKAMQLWLAEVPEDDCLEEVSIIERTEEHRALNSLLDGLRRQSEFPLD